MSKCTKQLSLSIFPCTSKSVPGSRQMKMQVEYWIWQNQLPKAGSSARSEKVCMQVPCQRSTKYGASQICYQKPALPHGPRTYECKCSAKGTLSYKHLKSVMKAGSSARSESVRIANALQKENEWWASQSSYPKPALPHGPRVCA